MSHVMKSACNSYLLNTYWLTEHFTKLSEFFLRLNVRWQLATYTHARQLALTFQSQTLSTMSCWYPMDTMCFILGEKATQATPYLWPSISAT